jgi:hypothetical protein
MPFGLLPAEHPQLGKDIAWWMAMETYWIS